MKKLMVIGVCCFASINGSEVPHKKSDPINVPHRSNSSGANRRMSLDLIRVSPRGRRAQSSGGGIVRGVSPRPGQLRQEMSPRNSLEKDVKSRVERSLSQSKSNSKK